MTPLSDSPPPAWLAKLAARLPEPVRNVLINLTPPQRRTLAYSGIGLGVFLMVWVSFSALQEQPVQIVSAKQLQIPSKNQGIKTAITQPVKNFPNEPTQAAATTARDPLKGLNLTPLQQNRLFELRQNVDNIYKSVLSFPLDEAKMIVFAQAATKVDLINTKWDTLIAGAATDALAAEYLSSATLESKQILNQTVGITASEYSEIYNLSARDAAFNKIANAYKELVAEGIWGPVTPALPTDQNDKPVDPNMRFPVAKIVAPNPATPAADGTAPTPPGSPTPPYLPPVSH